MQSMRSRSAQRMRSEKNGLAQNVFDAKHDTCFF